ncbi:hypothetical protein Trydic_g7301 [Trypoxylus dichotomus]
MTRIPGMPSDGANEHVRAKNIVNAFTQAFSGVFLLDISDIYSNRLPFTVKPIEKSDILKSRSALPSMQSIGDDLIPNYVGKDCKYMLVKSFSSTWRWLLMCCLRFGKKQDCCCP